MKEGLELSRESLGKQDININDKNRLGHTQRIHEDIRNCGWI